MSKDKSNVVACAAAVAATSLLGLGLFGSPAQASPRTSPTVTTVTTIKSGMWVVGVDEAVAAKAGYDVKWLSGGRFQLVPKESKSGLKASKIYDPQASKRSLMRPNAYDYDESSGDCGTSYISVQSTTTTHVNIHSGFSLNGGRKATEIEWKVKLADRNGNSYQKTSTNIHGTTGEWAAGYKDLYQAVYSHDSIVTADSTAKTTAGEKCRAGKASVSISMG